MDCTNAQNLLDAYVDGELEPLRNLEIEEHVHGCARCSQTYSDRQIIRGGLKTESLYFKAPADLQKRIQHSVRQAAKAEAPAGWFSGSWFKIAAPIAATALVVKPWFNGKLDFSPPVSDLAKQGFPLVGGRLDYLNNRPVAALVYQRDKHVINVFVWPSDNGAQTGGPVKTQQGYHVIRWSSSGMNFWVVSDLEQNQLAKFTDLLKSSTTTSAS